ncbi:hypothetical protein ABW20_dc0108711 [Dactylellina cionopaga]|nr:hypothetical protein ABW20_dc0108711 [Dactylellina cionopaga]
MSSENKLYDVVIAGAGPIGLFLAGELALAGASVLILERDLVPESPWKGRLLGFRGLNSQSIEGFYRRGLLYKLIDPAQRAAAFEKKPGFQFGGHFAGMMLDVNKLDLSRYKYRLNGPALVPNPTNIEALEKMLSEHAESLGVTILRGHGVTKIVEQDDKTVTVEAGENHQNFRGRWLVGCDGGKSVVRKAAGFEWAGTEANMTCYIVNCDFDKPDVFQRGFHVTKTGLYIITGPNVIYLMDFAPFDRTQEIKQDHLQEVMERITGITDVKITKVHLVSTTTDRSKQTTTYRKGRILLAGDAAHIHSPLGAQGLNLGLGDAINLGWKLAATLRKESSSEGAPVDLSLLDTYESERHPIAAWVLEWTRAQITTLQPDPYGKAVQALIRDLINTTDGVNLFIDRVWGLSQRYKLSDSEAHAHPLVGSSMPDFELDDGSRLGPKLVEGKGLLVDFGDNAALKELATDEKYGGRVKYFGGSSKDRRGIRGLLVRSDGIVAWLVEDGSEADLAAAKNALDQWFGF